MKTKSLFYSVAIAAAFASCAQEAIEVVDNNVQQDLSIRPTLGEIVLVEDADIASRFAVGNGAQPVFSKDDKLGAAIMDMPLYPGVSYNEEDPSANYKIVEYYSSNSAFTYDGSAWYLNEDQPLVEGNYMFYAPYNAAMQFRSPFQVRVPEKQAASTAKAALDEYYASGAVVRVGYQFLAAEDGKAQKPKVNMNDVFAYPKFTIKNNFNGIKRSLTGSASEWTGDLTVDSIQFVLNGTNAADVVLGGSLSNQNAADAMSTNWAETPFENYTADLLDAETAIKAENVITTLVAGGRVIKQGESAEFYAVMPAVRFDVNVLSANIFVTIDGKPYVFKKGWMKKVVKNETASELSIENSSDYLHYKTTTGPVTLIKGQRYPQEELNFENGTLSSKKIAGNALTLDIKGGKWVTTEKIVEYLQEIEVDQEDPATPVTELIDNNEEFISFFKELENGSNLTENTADALDYVNAKFAFSDDNTVTINAALIEALSKYNNKGTISITSTLPIANDVTVAMKSTNVVTFTTDGEVSYDITLDANNYSVTEYAVIANGKSVHVLNAWNATTTVLENVVVYEGATATIDDVQLEAASFINNGTLNVYGGNMINPVTNNATINVKEPKHLVVNAGIGEIIAKATEHDTDAKLASLNNVYVTGGTQAGIYEVAALTEEAVADAESITWVNELKVTNGNVAFSQDILDEIEDIKIMHITGASFPKGTFEMNGLTLCMEGDAAMAISGVHKTQTIVNDVVIYNETTQQINLNAIAANGTYSAVEDGGELVANGTTATWNGAAVGVDAKAYLLKAIEDGEENIVLPSSVVLTNVLTIPATFNGTIDLNGKTVNVGSYYVENNGNLILKNGSVKGQMVNAGSYAVWNKGVAKMTNVVVESSVLNHKDMTIDNCSISTTASGQNALVSGYNNQDTECYLTLKNSTLKATGHAAAKLQWNYIGLAKSGLYTIAGTTFEGNGTDLTLAGAKITWGEGNVLKNNKVTIFDSYKSIINNEYTRAGSWTGSWSEIFD